MLRTTEEIKARQTAGEVTRVVGPRQRADTGGLPTSRDEKKAMVSSASRTSGIDEAVKRFDFRSAS